jgi:glycosyltransferase involved in cell wall biosynthesis
VKAIRQAIKANRIDCIVLQYSPASFDMRFRLLWAFSRFPCQKITAFHTLWGKGWDRVAGLFMLFGSAKIIATNSEIMRILEYRLPPLLKRTYWIPIGTNILPSQKLNSHKSFHRPIISYFGMVYPGKGFEVILETIELLRDRGNTFKFKFIGGGMVDNGDYEEHVRFEIRKRNLTGIVDWMGLVPEDIVSRELSKSRTVFLPFDSGLSDRRGSFMAAIAHGRPVLTSPPVVEMPFLKNGVNVMWPEKSEVKQYVRILERLLTDDSLVSALSRGAFLLGNKFQWSKIARDYEMVLSRPR